MVPQLKALTSIELGPNGAPTDPRDCSILVTAAIGPADADSADNFDLTVVTSAFLARTVTSDWGRGMLIVNAFSWPEVRRNVELLLQTAARDTWPECAAEINKTLLWEFDNYRARVA